VDINLNAFIWLTQAAIPHMKRNGFGRLLVTSSVSARVAMGGGAHYSAAKAGVNAFVRGAAFELARDSITVNGVEPGFIAKPGRGTLSTPEKQAAIGRHIPVGHMGEADDIAYAMLYLASPEAKYTTGQAIVVDGGSTLPETGYAVEDRWGL
jgi:3-oxoacyl-[acyl-carrier protein] reductase